MKNSILLFIIVASLYSCKQFVDIPAPITRLGTKTVYSDNETANSAVTGLYSKIQNDINIPYRLPVYTGLAADELTNYSTLTNFKQFYVNGLKLTDASSADIWNSSYNYIYQSNAIIEGCSGSSALSADVAKQLTGEALFIRAFWHFYLVNLFGNVPLVISTDYAVNSTISRTDSQKVYQQIIEDLQQAKNHLNSSYVGANGISISQERVRPNRYAAAALLARVYLYVGDNVHAEQEATTVINNKPTYDIVPLKSVFLKNSAEAVWQLMMPTPNNNRNTYEGSYFILSARPATNFTNSTSLSDQLLNAFEASDQRKTAWIGKFTDGAAVPKVDYYYPFKYQVQNSASITEYSTVLRLAELYLIRAEARAKQDQLAGAISDLDVVRNRAGLSLLKNTNPNIAKDDLLIAILKERQVEFFTEWGHRWMDLKRTGRINSVMTTVTQQKGGIWDSNYQFWPIPLKDVTNNNNLEQNLGYK